MLALVNRGTFDSATGGTFQSDTDGTFHSDIPGTFESDMDGTFKVLQSAYLMNTSVSSSNGIYTSIFMNQNGELKNESHQPLLSLSPTIFVHITHICTTWEYNYFGNEDKKGCFKNSFHTYLH